jgi:hypothetical protein
MKNLHNWSKAVEQLVISVAEILELLYFFLKEPEDIIGGLAILEFLGNLKWILGQVYSGVLAIVSQGCIENGFKVGSGDRCRGHGSERKCWLRRAMEETPQPEDTDPRAYGDFSNGEVVSMDNNAHTTGRSG